MDLSQHRRLISVSSALALLSILIGGMAQNPSAQAEQLTAGSANWCAWTAGQGPLPIGCVTGFIPVLVDGRSVVPIDYSSSNPAVATVERIEGGNPWGQYRLRVTTVSFGTTQICYSFREIGNYGNELKNSVGIQSDSNKSVNKDLPVCHTVDVGPNVQADCGGTEINSQGFAISTNHMQLGCSGWSFRGSGYPPNAEFSYPRFQRVTGAWSSNPSILKVWLAPGNVPGVPNQAEYEAVGVGAATMCWSWEPRPEVRGDGGPACFKYTVHPPTVNVRDPRLTRALNEPLINFDPTAANAHMQMGGFVNWNLGAPNSDFSVTSSSPEVVGVWPWPDSTNVALSAYRLGKSIVCVESKAGDQPSKRCIEVTVHTPDVDVSRFDLERNLYTGPVESVNASTIPTLSELPELAASPVLAPLVVKVSRGTRTQVIDGDNSFKIVLSGKWKKGQKFQVITRTTATSDLTKTISKKIFTSARSGNMILTMTKDPNKRHVVKIHGGKILTVLQT
jgi:hypothetical protein